ncbi:MAG: amino acid adenylation domain-containing protein [Candidatus Ozemobacteraceae bacterium]
MKGTPTLFPLSHPELRIYLVQAIDPKSSVWNLSYAVKIDEPLDIPALHQAANWVVEEFDGLRQHFTHINGEIRKYVVPPFEVAIRSLNFIEQGGEATFDVWAKTESGNAIWALEIPLFQVWTAKLTETKSALFLKIHHIIGDDASAAVWYHRLIERYSEIRLQSSHTDHQKSRPYADFLEIENSYLASKECMEDKAYWLGRFDTLPETIELFPHSTEQSSETRRKWFRFPEDVASHVYAACQKFHTTPYLIVLAAQYVYWARISRNPDLVIGVPMANRTEKGFEETIGMFVSTMPLHLNFPFDLAFGEVVERINKQFQEIRPHQRYPYDLLASDLREKFGESPNPIQIMSVPFTRRPHACIRSIEFHCQRNANEPITTYVSHGNQGETQIPIEFATDYQTAVFTEIRVEAIHYHLCNIIRDGLANPGKALCRLNMISESERNRVLVEFNNTTAEYSKDKTLVDMFEAQVERTPDKTAVVYQGLSLTYHQLHLRVTRLAAFLRGRGVKPDSIVGLLVDHNISMIVAALGIMKSGAAYTPIDPNYPEDRIHYMLEDSKASILVTQGHYQAQFSFHQEILNLDEPGFFDVPVEPLSNVNKPSDLAIVMYTSGSAGRPKGIMLEHRSIVNFSDGFAKARRLTERDRIAKHAGLSVDSSLLEMYPTLSVGATLYIIPDDIRLNLVGLNAYYEKNGITGGFFTTTLGEQFNAIIANRSLRFLDVAGEKLCHFTPRAYQLYNGYGPTECSVYTTEFPVDGTYRNIPIGKPLRNYRVYILDAFNNPQPLGAPGELCVAGISLARGYLNLPDQTKAAFMPNPLIPGERIYRTGDLARWLPDGNLEFLGRIDRQVKMRGFRVEPGEIEEVLLTVRGVKQSAVIDFKEPNGRLALCAYVVGPAPINIVALKKHLGAMVPEYMIPAYILQIEKLPVTGSGKIDRKALRKPEAASAKTEAAYIAPRNNLEKKLVAIWEESLKMKHIGIDDDFFALGGHSFKAFEVLARMEKALGIQIPIRNFFKTPTIRNTAEIFEKGDGKKVQTIEPAPTVPHYPMTSAQRQLFILNRIEGIDITYNVPLKFRLKGRLDSAKLGLALYHLIERHESLRTSFRIVDGQPVQVILSEAKPKFRFLDASESEIDSIMKGFIRPFDLSKTPLMRAMLVKCKTDLHYLLLDFHQIAFDGVSTAVFIEDLGALYREESLPELKLQFKDYAVWKEKMQKSEEILSQGKFWHELFTDPEPLDMPTDFVRPPGAIFEGGDYELIVDRDLYFDVSRLSSETASTLHVVLLSSLHALLARFTGQEDVITGTSIGSRNHDELSGMIGMFVNTIPIRSRPVADKSFRQLLGEMKKTMLDIFQNQEYPLERLYESLNIRRGFGRHPLFDINLVSRNLDIGEFRDEGLESELLFFPTGTAKFDISVSATEGNGGLRFNFEYRSKLFAPETIARFGRYLLNLLKVVSRNPDTKLGEIDILNQDERYQLLTAFQPAPISAPWYHMVIEAFERNVEKQYACVPIGKSANNSRVYILDRRNRLQPIGIPGEICIAGLGLARGYMSDPEMTVQKFVPDPFVKGALMYRTGDLGRWLADGNLDFIGRADSQVKSRGYLIDLSKIEQRVFAKPTNDTEQVIADVWLKILGRTVGIHENFFESGGDSLRSIALVAELQKNFDVRVSDIFAYPTISEQAANLKEIKDNLKVRLHKIKELAAAQKTFVSTLQANASFLADLKEYRERSHTHTDRLNGETRTYRHVLLTGATGYLGVYILRELLEKRSCKITTPIRGSTPEKARERLVAKIEYYFGRELFDRYKDRIEVINADLTQKLIGLDSATYAALSGSVDCVLHSAANVRQYGPYDEFYLSNVKATENMLDFALAGRKKDFHHVSTTSVGNGVVEGRDWIIFSEFDVDVGQKPDNVYDRTKLEAERKVVEYRKKGLKTSIFRAENITYDSVSGRFQENIEENAFFHQVKGYACLGAAPDELDERNISSVDQSAAALVTLFDQEGLVNEIFHLSNPYRTKLSNILPAKGLELNIDVLSFSKFIDCLIEHYDHEGFRKPIENLLLHMGWLDFDPRKPVTRCLGYAEKTVQMLRKLGFEWKKPDAAIMRKMVLETLRERLNFFETSVQMFSLLNPTEIERLVLDARPVWVRSEETVIEELQDVRNVFVLVSGHLEVRRRSAEGWLGTVRLLGPGDFVGKDALIDHLPSPVNVEGIEDCLLFAFDTEKMLKLLWDSPRFSLGVAKMLSRQVNALEKLFVNMN